MSTEKPSHYKVVCISLYTSDIQELKAKVNELKRRGWTRANASHLVRLALAQMDVDTIENALTAAGMVQRPVVAGLQEQERKNLD